MGVPTERSREQAIIRLTHRSRLATVGNEEDQMDMAAARRNGSQCLENPEWRLDVAGRDLLCQPPPAIEGTDYGTC